MQTVTVEREHLSTPRVDQALIRQAQAGCPAAFDALIQQQMPRIYSLACRLMGNHADASDAAQEAFIKIYAGLGSYRFDAAFSSWVYRIVVNTCLDEKRRWHRSLPLDEAGDPYGGSHDEPPLPAERSPEEVAERHELQRTVWESICQLRDDYRRLIILRDLKGCSYQEIAAITGWRPALIKSRLHRARRALRPVLERCLASA